LFLGSYCSPFLHIITSNSFTQQPNTPSPFLLFKNSHHRLHLGKSKLGISRSTNSISSKNQLKFSVSGLVKLKARGKNKNINTEKRIMTNELHANKA